MSNYSFDEVIDRKNTNSLKYDFAVERGKPAEVLPLWVADMDFKTAPGVTSALVEAATHGIFGYTEAKENYAAAVINWYKKRFGITYKGEWLVKTPGIVFALALAVKAYTNSGDGVLIQTPVYYPFYEVIRDNNRRIIENPLINDNNKFSVDFEDFEEKIKREKVKLFILCSPHNPVGRVWTKDELEKVVSICKKHNVIIVSDEIHCDFVYEGYTHTPTLEVAGDYSENVIICTSPGKTFNIAGIQDSNIFIPGKELRQKFQQELNASGYSQLNTFAIKACIAAYETGEEWLDELKKYLKGNLDFVKEFIATRLPKVKLTEPEGTYLIWLDFSEYGLSKEELNDLVINKAGLWLDAGHIFGEAYEQYQRIVIAAPRTTISEAFEKLAQALSNL